MFFEDLVWLPTHIVSVCIVRVWKHYMYSIYRVYNTVYTILFISLFPHGDQKKKVSTRSTFTDITILVGTFSLHNIGNTRCTHTHILSVYCVYLHILLCIIHNWHIWNIYTFVYKTFRFILHNSLYNFLKRYVLCAVWILLIHSML